jgi:hypothetical protein
MGPLATRMVPTLRYLPLRRRRTAEGGRQGQSGSYVIVSSMRNLRMVETGEGGSCAS